MNLEQGYDTDSLRRAAKLLRRGGAVLLVLALLALTLTTGASYQSRTQRVHNLAFDRIVPVHEALERQGYLMDVYLKRLVAWREDYPSLALGTPRAQAAGFERFDLDARGANQMPVASVWLRPDAAPTAAVRAASVLNLAYLKQQVTPDNSTLVMFDRQGSLFASYPAINDIEVVQRTLQWSRGLGVVSAVSPGWAIRQRSHGGQCDCLVAYYPLELPGAADSLIMQVMPLHQLVPLFQGRGWFALLDDAGRAVYASAGAEPERWADMPLLSGVGVTQIEHRSGKVLVQRRLRYLPWTLVYSPSGKGESGLESQVLFGHLLIWLFGVLLLAWGYVKLRRLLLRPTQSALVALQHYQQQLKQNNQDLRVAKDQAEQANQARALFLAVMSHEIRTPLNGVMAMLELLDQEPLGPQARYALGLIQNSSDLLLHVITDILDFTKIQSGKVEFAAEPVQVLALANHMLEAQQSSLRVAGKPVTMVLSHSLPADVWLLVDPYRLRQVLGNLLSNAVKFTAEGQVELNLAYRDGGLAIDVRDSGIGMHPEQIARLFQPFVQAQASTARQYGGSGLGLAIIKGLLDQAGGTIEVESIWHQGSCFRLWLPCPIVPAPEPADSLTADVPASSCSGGVVWVVEDHPTNRAILQAQFQALGAEAHFSSSGAEALRALPAAQQVSLILTDISMPEMNGFEFTARLKGNAKLAAIPVVALSAHAFDTDIERGRAAGMADYLTKPVKLSTLRAALLRFGVALHPKRSAETCAAEVAPSSAEESAGSRLDVDGLMKMFEGNLLAVRTLVERYLECDQADLARLQQAMSLQDRAEVAQLAHRMGSAALYVDPVYADLLYALEEDAAELAQSALHAQVQAVSAFSQQLAVQCRDWLAGSSS